MTLGQPIFLSEPRSESPISGWEIARLFILVVKGQPSINRPSLDPKSILMSQRYEGGYLLWSAVDHLLDLSR